jgi:hypothetical protein
LISWIAILYGSSNKKSYAENAKNAEKKKKLRAGNAEKKKRLLYLPVDIPQNQEQLDGSGKPLFAIVQELLDFLGR